MHHRKSRKCAGNGARILQRPGIDKSFSTLCRNLRQRNGEDVSSAHGVSWQGMSAMLFSALHLTLKRMFELISAAAPLVTRWLIKTSTMLTSLLEKPTGATSWG
ncbi:hypothetical protein HispidOSU_028587 [Sigmodon hispidus]